MSLSDYDAAQIIRRVYDEVNNRLRTDATLTASFATVEVTINAADGDNIAINDAITAYSAKVDSNRDLHVFDTIVKATVDTSNSLLTQIRDYVDNVEPLLTNIDNNTDTLESLTTDTNTKLDTANSHLSNLETYTDGLEILITSTNTKLDTVSSNQTNGTQRTLIVDTNNDPLNLVKENDNYNASQHGIPVYGLDDSSPTKKWRPFKTDTQGDLYTHSLDSVNTIINPATSDNQTNGSQKSQTVDGSGTVVGPAQSLSGTNYLPVVLAASATPGSSVVARSVQVAGSDGTNARTLSTDTTGKANVNAIQSGTWTVQQGTPPWQVTGNVSAGATDSGNPVKTGGIYTTTIPLLTTGQRGDTQLDENSARIAIQNVAAYAAEQKVFSGTTVSTLTVGTTETALYLFKNPSGSSIKARIFKIVLTVNGSATFRFYHTPTITANGTAITPINQRIMTSPASAVVTPFYSPTISANGTFMYTRFVSAQKGTDDVFFEQQLILNSNFNLLITAQAAANNTPVNIVAFWMELP